MKCVKMTALIYQCFLKNEVRPKHRPDLERSYAEEMRRPSEFPYITIFTYQPSSAKYLIVRTIWLV